MNTLHRNIINLLNTSDEKNIKLAHTLLENLDLNITENSIFLCKILVNDDNIYGPKKIYGFKLGKYIYSIMLTGKHDLFIENYKNYDKNAKYGEIIENSINNPILSEIIKIANKYDIVDFIDYFEYNYANFYSRNHTLLDFSDEELLILLESMKKNEQ